MLVVPNAVGHVPDAARLEPPVTQDETMVHNVEQVIVDFPHARIQKDRCLLLDPLQDDAFDEIPPLLRVKDILAHVQDATDVPVESGLKAVWVLQISIQHSVELTWLERDEDVRPPLD